MPKLRQYEYIFNDLDAFLILVRPVRSEGVLRVYFYVCQTFLKVIKILLLSLKINIFENCSC